MDIMTLEEELKMIIKTKYGSVAAFAKKIDVPYMTIMSIFKRGIMSATLTNVKIICKELGISLDALVKGKIESAGQAPDITIESSRQLSDDAARLSKRLRAFEEALSLLQEGAKNEK